MDPPDAHPGAGADHAAADAEAAQGERGVHVAPGRRQIDEFIGAGHCEFISAYSQPFAMLVVADVLGVPEADHRALPRGLRAERVTGRDRRPRRRAWRATPSDWLDDWFASYIEDRRREPRDDVLTDLALATYPDGSTPDGRPSVVRTATFLFAAGQETTARLLAVGAEVPVRVPRAPGRAAGPPRAHPRLHRGGAAHREPGEGGLPPGPPRNVTVAGVDIAAGHAGHAAQRRGQPRPPAVRVPGRVPARPAQRQGAPRLRARASTPAPAGRWPGSRAGSASSASSTGCATSGSPRSTTVRRRPVTSSTSRPGSCAACTSCTSSSPRPRCRSERPGRRRDRCGVGHRPRRRPAAGGGRPRRGAARPRRRRRARQAAAELSEQGLAGHGLRGRRGRPRRARAGVSPPSATGSRADHDRRDQRRASRRSTRSPTSRPRSGTGSSR